MARQSSLNIGFRGNLSQRSLLDVVKKEDLISDSEFLETLLVAVPKSVLRICFAGTTMKIMADNDKGT